jgi:phage I-like protein
MISIRLSETGEVSQDVQLFRTGTFFHEEYGKFTINTSMLSEMLTNFNSKVRGVDIAIDYKHDSENIAAGWIKEVYLSEDGTQLWAKVEWTPNGKKVLAEKEFRYLSPEFVYQYQDNESLKKFGSVLLGAGLTNRPVIKNMEPVVELSEAPKGNSSNLKGGDMELEKMSPEQLIAMIKELQAKLQGTPGLEKELADMKAAAAKAAEEKACAEKKAKFAVMLSEGKVCKAQEEAFIAGDMAKFIELAQPMKLNEGGKGSSQEPPKQDSLSVEEAADKVLKLAEEKVKANAKLSIGSAISLVLSENKELSEKVNA